jgi:hypothetical protein
MFISPFLDIASPGVNTWEVLYYAPETAWCEDEQRGVREDGVAALWLGWQI